MWQVVTAHLHGVAGLSWSKNQVWYGRKQFKEELLEIVYAKLFIIMMFASLSTCWWLEIKWHQWLDHWSTNSMTQTSQYWRRWCAYILKVSSKFEQSTGFGWNTKNGWSATLYCTIESLQTETCDPSNCGKLCT
jgi:hypothetical protein